MKFTSRSKYYEDNLLEYKRCRSKRLFKSGKVSYFEIYQDIFAFMETRVNSNSASKIIERINWPNYIEVLTSLVVFGFSGNAV